jgi:DNA modification methylase
MRWPAEKVTMRRLDSIKPYPRNTRMHSEHQIKMLARIMKAYGVDQPIVVDENGVILKGHGRRLAAYEAGFKQFPVVVNRGLSNREKQEMRVADNQSALLADWDDAMMREQLAALESDGSDLSILGFDDSELEHWGIGGAARADVDDIPPVRETPSVRTGELWQLGQHRLLIGDCTLADNWDRLLNPVERAAMVFTDPPYGVSYETASGKFNVIEGDQKRRDDLYAMLLNSLRQTAARTRDDAAFYIWHASTTRDDFAQAMTAAGLIERQYLIWVKPSVVLGRADYLWQHEPCFYASKTEGKAAFYGNRQHSTVWHVSTTSQRDAAATIGNGLLLLDGAGASLYVQSRCPKNKKLRQLRVADGGSAYLAGARQEGTVWEVARDGSYLHPTQKPVELARRAIANSSRAGETIIDGFLGSGTTLIGAEITGRRCCGMELDPVYAQVIIDRWETLTGHKASRENNEPAASARKPKKNKSRRNMGRHVAAALSQT